MPREDAAEGKRSGGGRLPDRAEIFDQGELVRAPGETALMDADAEVGGARIERGHDVGEHHLLHRAFIGMKQLVEQLSRSAA